MKSTTVSDKSNAQEEALAQEAFIFPEEKILLFIFSPSTSPEAVAQVNLLFQSNSIFRERIASYRSFMQRHNLESIEDYLNYMSKSTDDFMTVFNDAIVETDKEMNKQNQPCYVRNEGTPAMGFVNCNDRAVRNLPSVKTKTWFREISESKLIMESGEMTI